MQKYLVNKFPGTILSPNIIIAQAVREEKKIFYFRHISAGIKTVSGLVFTDIKVYH